MMKNRSAYIALSKEWETYNDKLFKKFATKFPTTKGMSVSAVTKFLVENKWTASIQAYTYKAAKLGGSPLSKNDFTHSLLTYKTYEGKTINAWKNSREQVVARKMIQSLKPNLRTLEQKQAVLNSGVQKDVEALSKLVTSKEGQRQARLYAASPTKKNRDSVSRAITTVITAEKKEAYTHTEKKVNVYQGRRISQDQLQRATNDETAAMKEEDREEGLTLEGVWTLDPAHIPHSNENNCEMFARIKYFYDDDIPVPVADTHYGCRCSCIVSVIKKSEMKKR